MATINRKSFSSTIEPAKQPSILKVIVSNMTMSGFYRIVAVKTKFDEQGVGTDSSSTSWSTPRPAGRVPGRPEVRRHQHLRHPGPQRAQRR